MTRRRDDVFICVFICAAVYNKRILVPILDRVYNNVYMAESLELIHFTWGIPDKGYLWDHQARPDPVLGGGGKPPFLLIHPDARETRYAPLPFDEPGAETEPLFARFAALRPTEADIRDFANEYGWLGVGIPVTSQHYPGERKGFVRVIRGESLSRWRDEIRALGIAVRLYRWLLEDDQDAIKGAVRWESQQCVRVCIPRHGQRLLYRSDYGFLFQSQPSDPALAIRALLLSLVNQSLREHASPCLLLDKKRQPQPFIRPRNLVGALWLQLQQAILGQRQIRTCRACGGWMDVTGSRADKQAHRACVNKKKTYRLRWKASLPRCEEQLRKGQLAPARRRKLEARIRELREKLK